jgi:spoIIIJ-associated protein
MEEEQVYVFEGKTTNEAIEKGLKELHVSKSKVDIKVLEQDSKRSFFSILDPRVVKVEIRLKEGVKIHEPAEHKEKEVKSDDVVIDEFKKMLDDFISKLPSKDIKYDINVEDNIVNVGINGKDVNYLIGYRGETLNSLQTILTNIINKNSKEKLKVILNIGDFREKRRQDLENLATKVANTVVKTGKSITLEPMGAYDRKIIHSKLQSHDKVTTHSIGEEPRRKVVVELK